VKSFKLYLSENISGLKISTNTEDGFVLEGIYFPVTGSDTVLAHTHGTASFYNNEIFEPHLLEYCKRKGWGFLSFNNRGANIFNEQCGAAYEKFSDSPKDIDAWLIRLKQNGIKHVILSGHSLGTEKIANYVKNHKNDMVKSILLLAPSDTVGTQIRYENQTGKCYMNEAKTMIATNRGNELLSDRKAHAGVLPMSATAYFDFYAPGMPLEGALPFRNKNLKSFEIDCFALVPDNDHYNITSTKDYAYDLMKAGANVLICETDHDFNKFNTFKALCELMGPPLPDPQA